MLELGATLTLSPLNFSCRSVFVTRAEKQNELILPPCNLAAHSHRLVLSHLETKDLTEALNPRK